MRPGGRGHGGSAVCGAWGGKQKRAGRRAFGSDHEFIFARLIGPYLRRIMFWRTTWHDEH